MPIRIVLYLISAYIYKDRFSTLGIILPAIIGSLVSTESGALKEKVSKRNFTSMDYLGKICLIDCCQMAWRSVPLHIILMNSYVLLLPQENTVWLPRSEKDVKETVVAERSSGD